MGPMIKLYETVIALTDTTTITLPDETSLKACNSLTLLIHVLTIGGDDTWGFALNTYFDASTRNLAVANKTGVQAAGLYRAVLASNFDSERFAPITPRQLVVTNSAGTSPSITFALYAVYGD